MKALFFEIKGLTVLITIALYEDIIEPPKNAPAMKSAIGFAYFKSGEIK